MCYDADRTSRLGKAGEDYTAAYLKSKGYIIIKRNWRDSRYGEIDIVAENKENIVFVEVKTRHINSLVSGAEAVDFHKRQRVKNASDMFMRRLRTDLPPRIDVADVTLISEDNGEYSFKMNYIINAF